MDHDFDPILDRAFAGADRALADEAFVAEAMARIHRRQLRARLLLLVAGIAALAGLWFAVAPLVAMPPALTAWVTTPVVEPAVIAGAPLLAPLNSTAALAALGLLLLRALGRRLFF